MTHKLKTGRDHESEGAVSDNEINIAIAEWCGWTCEDRDMDGWPIKHWKRLDGSFASIPSYTTDLNAMWDAEKRLHEPQRTIYVNTLYGEECADNEWRQIHATARQRAEAFLKTIGKWKE